MQTWDAKRYLQFEKERTQPVVDLSNRIAKSDPQTILDIGCGPGNSTAVLREQFPDAEIIGIDSDGDMISKAQKNNSDLAFVCADIFDYMTTNEEKFDLVFSNSCVQWLPHHKVLLPALMNMVNDGGVLAIQMPYNYNEPIHRIIETLTTGEKWRSRFRAIREKYILSVSEYCDCLTRISSNFELWETVYYHILPTQESLLEWYRGTGLRPYLEQLNVCERAEFESDFLNMVKSAYPAQEDGSVIFRFPRLFFTAQKLV